MVKDKLVGNFVQEFAMLWDYADELRLKNPRSTIKMKVNRVTPESPLYFKRFYVYFEALKRGCKEGLITFVKSTIEQEWEQNKENMYKLDEAVAKELFSKNSKAWTKAFQGLHSVLDIVDNNICEAFNTSIVESRFKSIITMLEEIRVNMMTRLVAKRKQCSSCEYNYGLIIKKKFDDNKKEGVDWKMIWNGEMDPNDYLHKYYDKDTYLKAYEYVLQPINGSREWTKSGIEPVLPLVEKTMSSMPKKNRRKKLGLKVYYKTLASLHAFMHSYSPSDPIAFICPFRPNHNHTAY
ncbi:hypothetical protein J1N35_010877 [Gossypium stocksii]|uniref:Uncharacterized protein n=1 Tax=Gossypium stocksii TaxID=47602 RepID=A0A9D3W182_9ROSI|nr:hypothetical protein J1N35_010877 [Gossypium stocksii]